MRKFIFSIVAALTFTSCFIFLSTTKAYAAQVNVFIHRGDGTGVPGATVVVTNINTGQFMGQQPTNGAGWAYFNLPLVWWNSYRVNPLPNTCPGAQEFQYNGWNRWFYFVVQSPKFPCP